MPIKPENKARYPKNWKQIRISILERANNCCEFCGVENDNLRALCQRCHNRYDAEHRKETRLSNKNNSKIKNS